MDTHPSESEPLRAPDGLGFLGEVRGLAELPRLLWAFPDLARQPRGDGRRVLVMPGYGAAYRRRVEVQASR